ncbi:M14 family metallopeptidase [Niveibacterium sp. 24ML]|uniref:succinylglutamate desuccinylase/aspartoacylase family protein n=1 Tax=Niveibacterium sp. 24ML TaxID=2985512 RepID=UPI0022700028|nr:succinylglutamate desuccinylase/aspartoacylase family protein [Niveibacterium sp. 24ML]MCX9157696.1 M14 family metallopeptidase [Niveibacterium sp. 24ML]
MQIQKHALTAATPGVSSELVSLHFGTPGSGEKVYIQASLHADEIPGMLVAHHLRQRFEALEGAGKLRGEIVLVPVANPLGLAQTLLHVPQGRFDFYTGENYNRYYPNFARQVGDAVEAALGADPVRNVALVRAALRAAVSAMPVDTDLASLRRTLYGMACDADVVLDLHCDTEAVLHLYTGTPLWPQAEALARHLGAALSLLATESGDAPFDEACSQVWWLLAERFAGRYPLPLACMSATIELRGFSDVGHGDAARDADAIVRYLASRGVIEQAPAELPPLLREPMPLAGSMPVHATHGGVLVFLRECGAELMRGEVIAEIIDPFSGQVTALEAPVDGLLYARDNRRFATAGMRVAKVAGREALRSGKLLSA